MIWRRADDEQSWKKYNCSEGQQSGYKKITR
jgi:hypothetical protein